MRKLYTLVAAALMALPLQATHLMGGEITVQHIGGNDYVIAMLAYRDTIGVPMGPTVIFEISDTSGVIMTRTVAYDSTISGNLLPQYPYGVEIYLAVDTIQLTTPGMYEVGWSSCCRNHAIQNLTNPGGESMYFKTEFEVFPTAMNSTPFFLVPAAIFLPINVPWQYNPLPFDVDGDSLYWSTDAPLRNSTTYCAGYTAPPGDTANPFSLDPITGTISWTANTMGNFVATVLVEEFRNGVRIGSTRRDLQFIVTNPTATPLFTNSSSWPTDANGHYSFPLTAGVPFNLSVMADHGDANADLDMALYGELVQISSNPPSFSFFKTGNGAEIQGTMSWNVPTSMTVGDRFLNVVRVSDGLHTQDEAFFTVIVAGVGEDEVSSTIDPVIYPNPARDQVTIQMGVLPMDADMEVELINLYGQLVKEYPIQRLLTGNNILRLSLDVDPGMYFLRMNHSGQTWVQAFLIE